MKVMIRFVVAVSLALVVSACGDDKSGKDAGKEQDSKNDDDTVADETKTPCSPIMDADVGVAAENKAFVATLEWLDQPKAFTNLRAKLSFADGRRCAADSLTDVEFHPKMPTMGNHGTNEREQKLLPAEEGALKVINLEGVRFSMGGPWVVEVSAKVNGKNGLAKFNVKVP